MIRNIEEKDIPVILNWYNWYIKNSTATFETEELTLNEFKQRVHKITEKYPWIILDMHIILTLIVVKHMHVQLI